MKMLMLTDTHCGLYKDSEYWLNLIYKLFLEIKDICEKENINNIIHLGDFFDSRKSIGLKAIDTSLKIANIFEGSNIKVYLLKGNHDLYNDHQLNPSSLSIFDKFKNIVVVDEPYYIDDCCLCSWGTLLDTLKQSKYLFGHFPINSFKFNKTTVCAESSLNPEDFNKFQYVYTGHFHIRSEKKIGNTNIKYIGAPYQQRFNDGDEKKGYYVVNTTTDILKFIEFKESLKFKIIDASKQINKNDITNNIIKLIFTSDYGTSKNNKIIELVQSYKPYHLYTKFDEFDSENINPDDFKIDINIKNNVELFYEYIDSITDSLPKNIKPIILKNMIKKLYVELNNLNIGV